jgi:acyl-CoA dehydrogenase
MLYVTAENYDAGGNVVLESNMAKRLSAHAFRLEADIAATSFGGSFEDLSQDIIPFYLLAKLTENAPINNNIVLCFIAQQALELPKSH